MMKRKIMALLVLLVVAGIMGAMPVMAGDPYPFDSDTNDYILVDSVEDLTAFAAGINDGTLVNTTNVRLTEDIKLNATLNSNTATNWITWGVTPPAELVSWVPIGNPYHPYAGTFDGNNKTISGIYINAPGSDYKGLFGFCTSPAVIKDLKVAASYLNGNDFTGGIAGYTEGSITDCQVEANLAGINSVGGVAGGVIGTITDCFHHGSVTGVSCVGGVSGDLRPLSTISNCHNTGSVTGDHCVGGITGYGNNQFSMKNSYNSGDIRGNFLVGGIVGYNDGNGSFANCFYRTGSAGYIGTGAIAYGIGNAVSDETGKTEAKTAAAFASGEVAYQLNQYESPNYPAEWLHWTQNPGATTPSLTSDNAVVFDKLITFDYEEDGVADTYASGYTGSHILALPSPPAGYIYTYTLDSTTTSQAEMASYQFTAVDEVVFTVKKYQLTVNNEGFIEIGTPAELTEFAKYVNAGNTGANAILTADIALRDTSNWNAWNAVTDIGSIPAWIPIGLSYAKPYTGTFDGNNKTISGIYINAPDSNYLGLFGYCTGSAAIKDLKVAASYLNGGNYTGGIAGCTEGGIMNCQVEANLVGKYDVGGVAGKTSDTISDSSHTGIVSGYGRIGGITGSANAISSVHNCYNSGSVDGFNPGSDIGGIVGLLDSPGNVSNCYNSSAVTGVSPNVGGIAGTVLGSISNCYNTGSVTGNQQVGGITGFNSGTNNIINCYYRIDSAVCSGTSPPAYGIGGTTEDTSGSTEVRTAAAFASGEVTWLLQAGQPDPTLPVWGQQLTVDALPLLKITDKIFQVTFHVGNGITTESKAYANLDGNVTLPSPAPGYVWKDPNQAVFGAETAVTGDIALKCGISALPTATAAYGTRLGAIAFSGGSVPTESWSWATADKDTVLAVGNTTAYPATYTPSDAAFATETFSVPPVITPRSLSAAGVSISQPANASYTGSCIEPAVTVTDSEATITPGDYTVSYTSNTSPGTATVTITGQGNYQGTVTRNFTIYSSGGGSYTPPSMWGITVTPHTIAFDPTGQLAVDITGAPAGATVYYSLDGNSFSTAPPAITNAGEHLVYIRITCPGYQDYRTQTTVTVAKQVAPAIPVVSVPISSSQPTGSTDLGALLPADRGQTRYQLGPVTDPGGLLNGPPTIDPNGLITYGFRSQSTNSEETVTAAAKNAAATATIAVQVKMENYADTTITLVVEGTDPEPPAPVFGVRYLTHVQDSGWESEWVTDGALSGTYGQSKRLEALKVELTGELPAGASIETTVHVQNQGDLGPFAMGSAAGTTGLSLRLENICLTLNNLPGYTLLYNVHVQNRGWLRDETDSSSWFRSGEVAGTSALSLRLEGIQIKLVKTETDLR
jgi:hypothetical protein